MVLYHFYSFTNTGYVTTRMSALFCLAATNMQKSYEVCYGALLSSCFVKQLVPLSGPHLLPSTSSLVLHKNDKQSTNKLLRKIKVLYQKEDKV
jgi:hypothetical protein